MTILRALGYLWALPGTIVGLLLGATTFERPTVRRGVLVFEGARGFAALHRRLGFRAITFGHVVISSEPLDVRLFAQDQFVPYLPAAALIWLFSVGMTSVYYRFRP